jgi:cytochrome c-type biogenesis protein CcmH
MAAGLAARLASSPADIDNWVLLGRTQAALQHWNEARDAFTRALALNANDPALHAQMGEVLTLAAGGTVTSAALAEFGHAPNDPRARYYTALARAQSGDTPGALAQLNRLAAEAPPDATWRQLVQDEIDALSRPASPVAGSATTGDASTSAEISDYLAHLDTPPAPPPATPASLEVHLRAHPDDAGAWEALSRAYQAHGDAAMARDSMRRANAAIPGNLGLLLAYADLLSTDIRDSQLPPALVATMRQVAALDANQPDALWYLGQDAANRGDAHAARKLWARLLAGLPAESPEQKAVQQKLDQLH